MIAASEAAGLSQRPPPIYLEGKLPVVEIALARQLGLRNSQVVQASVESQAGQWQLRFQSGVRMDIPREWPVAQGFKGGESIQWTVTAQPDGGLLLRPVGDTHPLNLAAPLNDPQQASDPLLPDRLAQLLVRPQDMKGLQDVLQPGVLEQLARQVGDMPGPLAQWLRARPSMGHLSGEQIRTWLLQSGWFNEGLLAGGRPAPLSDLKSALRALQRSLQQTQDGKTRLVEEALDDLESSQLAILSHQAGTGESAAGAMLAFRDMPPVRLSIRREGSGHDDAGASFVVDLQVQTPGLGEVWLRTRITDSSKLDMTMWSTRAEVVELAQRQSSGLRQQLAQAGLHLQSLQILQGKAPTSMVEPQGKRPGQVLDVLT